MAEMVVYGRLGWRYTLTVLSTSWATNLFIQDQACEVFTLLAATFSLVAMAPSRMKRARGKRSRNKPLGQQNQLTALSRQINGPTYRFRRVFQETITGVASGILAYTPIITLAKLPSVAEFSSLFTEYHISRVTVVFRPVQSTFSLIGPATFPVINTVHDNQDITALSGLTAALQYPSWKQNTFSVSRPTIQYSWAPRVQATSFATSGNGASLLPAKTFLGMSNTNTEHYGLKTVIEEFTTGVQMQVTFLIDFEVRGPK